MKITPLELRSMPFKKSLRGYDTREVDSFKELAASALEDAFKEIAELDERLKQSALSLGHHAENEKTLKDAITTAQKVMDDIRANAKKEAELIVAEAKVQGDEIVRLSQGRALLLQDEIYRLKKQRQEIESAVKAILDYHSSRLLLEEEEYKKADEESEKIKFMPK